MSPSVRALLTKAMAAEFKHMRDQGADSYSIGTKAFTVLEPDTGAVAGYGVWGGAPGDIGDARVTFYGLDGARLGSMQRPSNRWRTGRVDGPRRGGLCRLRDRCLKTGTGGVLLPRRGAGPPAAEASPSKEFISRPAPKDTLSLEIHPTAPGSWRAPLCGHATTPPLVR